MADSDDQTLRQLVAKAHQNVSSSFFLELTRGRRDRRSVSLICGINSPHGIHFSAGRCALHHVSWQVLIVSFLMCVGRESVAFSWRMVGIHLFLFECGRRHEQNRLR